MPEQAPVSASKIVKLRDLQIQLSAFAQINNLNFIDKFVLDAEEKAVGKKAQADRGKGLYVETEKPSLLNMYIDSKYVDQALADIRKSVHNPAQTAELDKVNGTIHQAMDACPDHAAQLKAGKLKPVAPKM